MKKHTSLFILAFNLLCFSAFSQANSETINHDSVFNEIQNEPLDTVEIQPVFPGGDSEMYKFLGQNMHYPTKARNNNVQGRVYASFVVEKDGTLSDVKILRGIGSGCDEEVIRVIKAMPTWTPGYQRGKIVRVRYNLPIVFKLQKGKQTKEQKAKQKESKKQYKQRKKEEDKKLRSSSAFEEF